MNFNEKQVVLFDLDGTLCDSKSGIARSFQYALRHFGIEVADLEKLNPLIGPPIRSGFMELYGFTKEQADEATIVYREYFGSRGMFENTLYAGILDMLAHLRAQGKRLIIATSKAEVYAKQIVTHFGLDDFIEFTSGAMLSGERSEKTEVIKYTLEKAGIKDFSCAVMVGDRNHDIIGAKTCGISAIGVLYGYSEPFELENAGADVLAQNVSELEKILLGG